MAKMYSGTVSVVKNLKGQITVKKDDDGKFNNDNAKELYDTMLSFGKKLKAEVKFFKPEPSGDTPLLMTDKWGNPYLAVLPASKAPGKATVTKLA